ncbi:MAG: hypothetical protein LBV41_05430 [Cytophagaceae bacterium]|nr:hypothetical protein [Cytophagaceae bacterium]
MKNKTIALSFLLIFLTNQIFACTCFGVATLKQSIKSSDYLFIGVCVRESVITVKNSYNLFFNVSDSMIVHYDEYFRKYEFQVTTLYKGKQHPRFITIYTGYGNGDCGYRCNVGKSYIVFAEWMERSLEDFDLTANYLGINICQKTQPYSDSTRSKIESHIKSKKMHYNTKVKSLYFSKYVMPIYCKKTKNAYGGNLQQSKGSLHRRSDGD